MFLTNRKIYICISEGPSPLSSATGGISEPCLTIEIIITIVRMCLEKKV